MSTNLRFGPELRRLRVEAGLTLTEFSVALTYDKGHLSKVERGERSASPELARRCDAFLGADGELQRLVPRSEADPGAAEPPAGPSRWSVGRRAVLSAGTGALIDLGLNLGSREVSSTDTPLLLSFRMQFDQLRILGQSTAPRALLPLLETQTRMITGLAADAQHVSRAPALLLASRFAEFTGWMAQEAGDGDAALGWTGEAAELARAGGDPYLGSYALVRRALVTMYGGDAAGTVALARRAQSSELPPRIRGLAAQREAQGHALVGNEVSCLRSLDRARELLAADDAHNGEPVIGTSHVSDPAAMSTGWCLHDLGRPKAAAEVLDREYRRLPPHALRTRARYGFRRSLAHAASGEVEHACEIAGDLLGMMPAVPSATVNSDVRRLARELSRFRSSRAVRDLQPALARVLAPAHD
ncbi:MULTISPECIES: helix-turn-helix domain-containing protein [Streptomyces]|uniref:helix-turn-helix domain-containing protein n=1 Tax=Streptomyces TaxID=1883 RepID=UPI0004AA52A5|nr:MULTISPECIES: helix-turn-helix transcriptional regulator [Streptomyces]MCX4711370.1 helix-turn-helix transcriptional regulator [Streptomyces griseus]QXQ99168.1 helix-turn-helix transcriptional regulator [Streptomyces sp. WY228]WKN17103.1 helix-turn-helix transcriptional regulator [Streptomyces sp. JUS-F4]